MPSTSPTTWQLIGQLSTIGFSFVLALVLGFGGGYWLDRTLGTQPWLSFIGFFCGLAAGVLNVYRVLQLSNASGRRSGSSKGSGSSKSSGSANSSIGSESSTSSESSKG